MPDIHPQSIEDLTKLVEGAVQKDEQARAFADAKLAKLEEELQKEREARAAIERQLEVQVVTQTLGEIKSFADGLVEGGKLPPALLDKATTLLAVAANLDGEVKSYALGDSGEHAEKSVFSLFSELLDGLPVSEALKPVTKDAKAASRPSNTKVDVRRYANDLEASQAMHERVLEIKNQEKLSYLEAFKKASREALDAQ